MRKRKKKRQNIGLCMDPQTFTVESHKCAMWLNSLSREGHYGIAQILDEIGRGAIFDESLRVWGGDPRWGPWLEIERWEEA